MKASEIVKEIQQIIDTEGDLDVDISLEKQVEHPIPEQQYLIADARFVIVEPYEKGKRISIRDWPY